MQIKTPLILTLTAIVYAMIAGCSAGHDDKVLTVSIDPQKQILEEIVGDRLEVRTLLPQGADPESFEMTLKTRKDADNSLAYFTVGSLPFEQSVTASLARGVTIVDCSRGITPIYGTHGHDHGDVEHSHNNEQADPHTWTSVRNMRIMAANMLKALESIDPEGMDYYRTRYKTLDARLDSLDKAIAGQLAGAHNRSFAVWHPSLSYFARDYGLRQIAVGYENKEPSPTRLAEVINRAKHAGVNTLFVQQQYDSRQIESLNSSLRARTVIINPLDYDWQKQLQLVTSALTSAE